MKIGIDLISSIDIIEGTAKYTGGMNYVKGVLREIIKSNISTVKWVLIFPSTFNPEEEDSELFNNSIFTNLYVPKLEDSKINDLDILFLPQVNGSLLSTIKKIKQKNSSIKIYATLHDRQHNFYKYDWMDRYYYNGIKRTGFPGWVEYYIKRMAFNALYKRSVTYIDKIFTVSNYSMQELMHKNIKNIKYFIQGNIIQCDEKTMTHRGDYILFVGGGRPEKNLFRTLIAFQRYKQTSERNFKLIVTGVPDQVKSNLISAMGKKYDSIRNYVEFMTYLPYDELKNLYSNCRYVIFTSKGEGYGLPVREAFSYGKTVLASRTTSVPEVAGAALCYVDPFDIVSIANGFELLDSDTILDKYENYAKKRIKEIDQIAKQDMDILIDELLE